MANYRYTLRRSWIGNGPVVNFVMLNPSTADDVFDDPTIRKCIGFAKRWGFSGLVVTNLFAFRATSPLDLKACRLALAVGPDNDYVLRREASLAGTVICAWGEHGAWKGRDQEVMNGPLAGLDLGRIGSTRTGYPLHPSRCAYTSSPEMFRIAAKVA